MRRRARRRARLEPRSRTPAGARGNPGAGRGARRPARRRAPGGGRDPPRRDRHQPGGPARRAGLAEAIAHRELGDRSRALGELEALAATPAETMLYCRILAMLELTGPTSTRASSTTPGRLRPGRVHGRDRVVGSGARSGWPGSAPAGVAAGDGNGATSGRCRSTTRSGGCRHRPGPTRDGSRGRRPALDAAVPRCARHEVVLGLLRAGSADHDESVSGASALELAAATSCCRPWRQRARKRSNWSNGMRAGARGVDRSPAAGRRQKRTGPVAVG